ncbi:MAG: cytochrome P450 [Acidimicrobiales bacterium]|jgi:cytochrome P450
MTNVAAGLADQAFNPLENSCWTRPQAEIEAELAALRQLGPTFFIEPLVPPEIPLPQGPGAWALTNHADILHVSRNPQIFSSAKGITVGEQPPEFLEFFSSMIAMDDPRHARLRRIVSAGFTPRMLKRLEESVQDVAIDIVDNIVEKGEVDFVTDVSSLLPLKVVCDLMGIPGSELGFVFDRSNVILGAADPEYVTELGDIVTAILTAGAELAELMKQVVASKKGGDGTDLTSVLVNAELEDDQLSPEDLASFFILLVVAGNETTRNATSWGLTYLTENPEQKAIWADDFDTVAPTAVEEIVRLASPVTYMRRTALADTVVGGKEIKEGQKLCMFYLAANRDEAVFADPYQFDVRRTPNPHLGYGGPGPHFCLGAHLARREITVMFRELLRRVPDIHASGDPDVLQAAFIHGIKHLPASFTPTARTTKG